MEATVEVRQWILVFFVAVFIGLLALSVASRIRIKRRDKQLKRLDKQLIELQIEKCELEDEVTHLIHVHRYIDPVVLNVNSLSGITWQALLREGTTTVSYPESEVEAAIRVQEKYLEFLPTGKKQVLYLNQKALAQSSARHHQYIGIIDGALGQVEQSA